MKTYSTVQVAERLGISRDTLHRWIREGSIAAPKTQKVGPFRVRLWSDEDVEKLKRYKAEHFWGKGSQKKRKKKKAK